MSPLFGNHVVYRAVGLTDLPREKSRTDSTLRVEGGGRRKQTSPSEPLLSGGCCWVLLTRPAEEMPSQACDDGILVSSRYKPSKWVR